MTAKIDCSVSLDRSSKDATDRTPTIGRTPPLPLLDNVEVEWVDIGVLSLPHSPRLAGENPEHTRVLAEIDTLLPPIIVHRPTMRVIDGMHRLSAAVLKGQERINVRFFDGSKTEAFLLAVRYNIAHGLPLSLADREAAAAQIIELQPDWSDRAVAAIVGLAARTVRGVRHDLHGEPSQEQCRVGRDGRTRPLNGANGRRLASELIAKRPDASLREVAREAHISLATARDVRERMRRGENPVPPSQRSNDPSAGGVDTSGRDEFAQDATKPLFTQELTAAMRGLRSDPSLRLTESGRAFLRWLAPRSLGPAGWHDIVRQVPPHSAYVVAKLARRCAEEWLEFAKHLERQDPPA